MNDKVIDYLIEYGFTKENIDLMEEENDEVFFLVVSDVKKRFSFLESKGFEKKDIISLVNRNQMFLTCREMRYKAVDEIYSNDLEFTVDELKKLAKKNEYLYSISPISLKEIIIYLKNQGLDTKQIKHLILEHPSLIELSIDEYKEKVKL